MSAHNVLNYCLLELLVLEELVPGTLPHKTMRDVLTMTLTELHSLTSSAKERVVHSEICGVAYVAAVRINYVLEGKEKISNSWPLLL